MDPPGLPNNDSAELSALLWFQIIWIRIRIRNKSVQLPKAHNGLCSIWSQFQIGHKSGMEVPITECVFPCAEIKSQLLNAYWNRTSTVYQLLRNISFVTSQLEQFIMIYHESIHYVLLSFALLLENFCLLTHFLTQITTKGSYACRKFLSMLRSVCTAWENSRRGRRRRKDQIYLPPGTSFPFFLLVLQVVLTCFHTHGSKLIIAHWA